MSRDSQDDQIADRAHLVAIRTRLDLTQEHMAKRLGMSVRAYSDIETGISKTRTIHVLAAERVSLHVAREREDASLADYSVVQDARAIMRGSNS